MIDKTAVKSHALREAKAFVAHTVLAFESDDEATCRLCEMGLSVGSEVTIEKAGEPSIVRVGATRLALSRELLAGVRVRCSR